MKFDTNKCTRRLAEKGWTRTMLADRARVSKAVVSNFLNGKSIRIDTAKKIVVTLGFEMYEVIRNNGRAA